jgi:signal transduction histidine kinase
MGSPKKAARLLNWGRRSAQPADAGRTQPTSWQFVVFAAVAIGAVSFLVTELMHYVLVPDIGRSPERLLAEGFSALVAALLAAKLIQVNRERHQMLLARMQVIAEMNHHIRNALSPLSLSLDDTENQQLKSVVSEAVDRIDWALREILPRETPLGDQQRSEMGYFQRRGTPSR